MRNVLKFLIAGTMIAGAVVAQEKSESVDGIMKELASQTAVQPVSTPVEAPAVVAEAPAVEAAPSAVVATNAVKKSNGWKFWKKADQGTTVAEKPAVVVAPAESVSKDEIPPAAVAALDVPATVEASRELYANGEFVQAQRGFEAVVKKDPENMIARMYLRKILERDPRITAVQGMKEVDSTWKTALVLRSYAISADAASKMGVDKVTTTVDVTPKFPEVCFPKGASAVYQPKTEKLFVRNTCENLLVLEEILGAMDVTKLSSDVDQVEIEAKFAEVSQGTLEELGFNWQNLSSIGGNDGRIPAGQNLFSNTLRTMPFTQPVTLGGSPTAGNGEVAATAQLDDSNNEWKAFRFDDTFSTTPDTIHLTKSGGTPLDIMISALDQNSGTDILSAPRIVTQSGKKATIRVGEMHYFPEVYEVGGSEGNIINVKYQDFSEKLLGVELDVNPKVDGDQITLSLNPKVSELLGWQNYLIAPTNTAFSYYQFHRAATYTHDQLFARLPIFKRREIKTEVTVADGSTIGMGGLINEKVEKFEDKVPVLGDIPLIGRLFRNEGERNVKRNLMIFVTAKKVEPTGRINTARSFE